MCGYHVSTEGRRGVVLSWLCAENGKAKEEEEVSGTTRNKTEERGLKERETLYIWRARGKHTRELRRVFRKLLIGCDISSQLVNGPPFRQKQKYRSRNVFQKEVWGWNLSPNFNNHERNSDAIDKSIVLSAWLAFNIVTRCPCLFGLAGILNTFIRISGSDSFKLTKSRNTTYQGHPACSWKSDLPKGVEMVPKFFWLSICSTDVPKTFSCYTFIPTF